MISRIAASLLVLSAIGLAQGCGGASGIKEGMPAETAPPPNFDPGGDAKPDMTGKGAAPKI